MNKQIKILVLSAILLVIGILIFSNWGQPESELEKTNIEEIKTQDFSSILGTTWLRNDDKSHFVQNASTCKMLTFY